MNRHERNPSTSKTWKTHDRLSIKRFDFLGQSNPDAKTKKFQPGITHKTIDRIKINKISASRSTSTETLETTQNTNNPRNPTIFIKIINITLQITCRWRRKWRAATVDGEGEGKGRTKG
ncbi:hypothetical protein Droror1_Dr00025783 [Drosera rotundifolia]